METKPGQIRKLQREILGRRPKIREEIRTADPVFHTCPYWTKMAGFLTEPSQSETLKPPDEIRSWEVKNI